MTVAQGGGEIRALKERIARREARVAVIGLGYVGLPLAITLADAGFPVIGIDIDAEKVAAIRRGESYIEDVSSDQLRRLKVGRLRVKGDDEPSTFNLQPGTFNVTLEYAALRFADIAIICVPTPLSKAGSPDLSYIITAADAIAEHLHPGMLVVLESTTYPGTTEEVLMPRLLARSPHLEVGKDIFLAYSPERVDPGRKDWTIRNTPKLVGGVTPQCLDVAVAFYRAVVERVVPVSSPKVAETAKLLENTFRAVNIALANEFAVVCHRLGIDVWEVIEAAKTKPFGFMAFYPGPGLGGHCLPIDPHYLNWKLRLLNYNVRFVQLAEEINFNMPYYVLTRIADALNDEVKPLKHARILILGVTYKPDVNDIRESPALDLIHLLLEKGARVAYHDPYIPALHLEGIHLERTELTERALAESDCVVIVTHHSAYDWEWIATHSRLIVDTRNALRGVSNPAARIVKL